MSADGMREELEAAAWRAITDASVTDHGSGPCPPCQRNVDAILAAADKYGEALAHEAMDRAEGRERLAGAAAEKYGEKS